MHNQSAACRAGCDHVFATSTELLKAEHRVIEQVLDAIERLAQAPGKSALPEWARAIDFCRNFADKCHHLKEETILFPVLEARGIPREGGPIGMMLAEHEEGRGYVRAMAAALETAPVNPAEALALLQQKAIAYVRLLREHIMKEDEVLFGMADSILSDEEQKGLIREFEAREAGELGAGVHEKYVRLAEELGRNK